ncbi:MAG: hypothetical protein ACR2JR_12945 [Rubrobacteraceae bacterium]
MRPSKPGSGWFIGIAVIVVTFGAGCAFDQGVAQDDGAASDGALTIHRCINDRTSAPLVPMEERSLVEAGIVRDDLGKTEITREACEEIMDRTPGGGAIERAVMAGNVVQELDLIREDMETAVEGDVNGDGVVNAEDSRTASTASQAAARAAREAVGTSVENPDGAGVDRGDLFANVASLQQYDDGGQYDDDDGSGSSSPVPEENPPPEEFPVFEEIQDKAQAAAVRAGASETAATAGGDCAAGVARFDGKLPETIEGNMVFNRPPEEMRWGESRDIKLVLSPAGLASIRELGRQITDAQAAGDVDGGCIGLTERIEAHLIGSGFGIEARPSDPTQAISSNTSTEWGWGLAAKNKGAQHLYLNVRIDMSSNDRGEFRSVSPPVFDDYVNVKATLRQDVSDFAGRNWQWLWTAILVPVGIWLWGRYRGSDEKEQEE